MTDLITLRLSTSITDTSPLTPLVASNCFSSGVNAICQTRRPTSLNENPGFAPELLQALTRKQLLVLERMTKGESNKQIAYTLEIAETTVKAHVSAILRKLNVHNRVQAILSAGDIDFGSYLRR